jgi:hypothetical protein
METLTIEHLAAYLPYGLMGISNNDTIFRLGLSYNMRGQGIEDRDIATFINSRIKPILYPLSSLTETIWFEGKEICPIEWLEETYYTLSIHKECERLLEDDGYKWINHMSHLLVIHLLRWRVDIFDLIPKGLAVDVNTLETKPYK